MNVITPEQSERIGREIFDQAATLNDMADIFAPPWGALGRVRMTRLYRERMRVAFPFEAMEMA